MLESTFEAYLTGRSKNTPKALARVERGLTELCGRGLAVDRITEPEQVPEFLRLIGDRREVLEGRVKFPFLHPAPCTRLPPPFL